MNQPNIEAAIAYALDRLAAELSGALTYHSIDHTRNEVLPAATELARQAGLGGRDTDLLRVAAAFHDLGFIERPDDHEICSARQAAQVLPAFAFDARAIEEIMSAIVATRLPQSPRNLLEQLMCDADLSGLGSDAFFERSHELLHERRALGNELGPAEWLREQTDFLLNHRYWTVYAETACGPGKARNIARLRERLLALDGQAQGY